MIDKIDILHESHSGDFASHAGEKSARLFCVIPYHHKTVVELGEHRFNPFSELFVSPCRRSPVFLIQPIRHFKNDVCDIKKVLLHLCAEIAFVAEHHAVMIFPLYILEVIEVVDTCRRHVVGMDNAAYSTDSVELISVIIHPLRCAIAPVWSSIHVVTSHGTTLCPCILANLYGFGINAEHILGPVNGNSYILADFFCKSSRQLSTGIELSATDQVWQILFALMMKAVEKKIFTVESESLGCYAESYDFEIRELRDNSTTGHVSEFIHTISGEILSDSENSDEICYEVAHKQSNSS